MSELFEKLGFDPKAFMKSPLSWILFFMVGLNLFQLDYWQDYYAKGLDNQRRQNVLSCEIGTKALQSEIIVLRRENRENLTILRKQNQVLLRLSIHKNLPTPP